MCLILREEQKSFTLLVLKEGCYLGEEGVMCGGFAGVLLQCIRKAGAGMMGQTPGELDSGSPFTKTST